MSELWLPNYRVARPWWRVLEYPTVNGADLSFTTTSSGGGGTPVPFAGGGGGPGATSPVTGQAWALRFNENWDGNDAVTGASYGSSSYGASNWANPHWGTRAGGSNGSTNNAANLSVSGGRLRLVQDSNNGAWTDTAASSGPAQKYNWLYGYLEAQISFVATSGGQCANWPAFWTSADGPSWPIGGEWDIAEGLSGTISQTIHCGSSANSDSQQHHIGGTGAAGADHIWGLEWWVPSGNQYSLRFYYDGTVIGPNPYTFTPAGGFGSAHGIILNTGNGQYGGSHVSGTMTCKYVRHWH